MHLFDTLNEDNFILYAAKHYYNPICIDAEEFYDDLKRFTYLARLISRYQQTGDTSERLILNHMIVIFNVFGYKPGLKMLEYKIGLENWHIIKPFLVFLRAIENTEYVNYTMDPVIVNKLRTI
jgi:hypothetical protein